MLNEQNIRDIETHARSMRRWIIRALAAAGSGHLGGSLGQADVYATLYFGEINGEKILRFSRQPLNLLDPARDILVQSNGHTAPVRYAAFHELGLIDDAEMLSLRRFGSRLQGHPERVMLPEVGTTSGPLGEGLSQAAGMALGFRLRNENSRRVFVSLGDGELDEGENWEAIMFAAKNRLNNLVAIVDFNGLQLSGSVQQIMPLEPLADKFTAFGWNVLTCDGNNVCELLETLAQALAEKNQPTVIISKTVMGAGVPEIENDYHWHGKAPTAEQAERWIKALDDQTEAES